MWHCWAVPKLSSVCPPMISNGFLIESMGDACISHVSCLWTCRGEAAEACRAQDWNGGGRIPGTMTSHHPLECVQFLLILLESNVLHIDVFPFIKLWHAQGQVWCWNSLTVPELGVVSWTSYCPIWASDSEDGLGGTNLTTKGESNPSCQAARIQVWSEHAKAGSEEVGNSNWSSPFYEGWPSRHWPAWQSSKGMLARNLVYRQITCKQVKATFSIPVLDLHLFL